MTPMIVLAMMCLVASTTTAGFLFDRWYNGSVRELGAATVLDARKIRNNTLMYLVIVLVANLFAEIALIINWVVTSP